MCENILILKAAQRGNETQDIFTEGVIRLLNRNDEYQKTMEFHLPMQNFRPAKKKKKSFKNDDKNETNQNQDYLPPQM